MKRFEGSDTLTRAMNDVLDHMSGCPEDPDCVACRNNRDSITGMVAAAADKERQRCRQIVGEVLARDDGSQSVATLAGIIDRRICT